MTGPVPPLPPEDREGGEPQGDRIAFGRALVLLVAAVVVGFLCLQVGARPPAKPGATVGSAATTTTTAPARSTTTTAAAPNPAVKVLVANGGAASGAAAYFTSKLQTDRWTTLTPANATPVTASGVYYATGQQASAAAVATAVGLAATAVHPIATAPPVQGLTGVDVLLVVGPDLSSQVPSSGTSGSTGSSTSAG